MIGIKGKCMSGALIGLGVTFLGLFSSVFPVQAQDAKGINVQYHTQKEISNYIKKKGIDVNLDVAYTKQPSPASPYKAGKLTDKTLNEALQTLNAIRYIAGIDDNVTLDTTYNEKTQAVWT